jgi:MHS family shikimate/dehydroshikimate transporter-like MFS transporter
VTSTWKLSAATLIGNTIEVYDFNVYGTLTAIVFATLFFPSASPGVGILLAFVTYAVGFLSRPLGGIVFGHLGDKYGRRSMLMWSLCLMGGTTFCMGLLPTYATAGIWAPILLAVLRFAQGFGVGGEWGGAVSLMVESTAPKRRGWYASLVQTGSGWGIILSSATLSLLLAILGPAQLAAWGWRIPFLLSIVLVIVGIVVRRKIDESPVFQHVLEGEAPRKAPVLETIRRFPGRIGLAIGMYMGTAAFGYMLGVFVVSYLVHQLHLSQSVAVNANLVAGFFYIAGILLAGWLSDRFGRLRVYLLCGILLVIAPFLLFAMLGSGSVPMVFVAFAVADFIGGLPFGVTAALFTEMFPARIRYSGISLGFQIATVLGGALTPTIASLLLDATGGKWWSVATYVSALALLMIACILGVRGKVATNQPAPDAVRVNQ